MTNEETHKLHRLYELYEQPMYRIAFAVLKNPHDAEDAVSEAFMRIIKRLESIKDPSSPKTRAYIVKVIKSTSADIYRKNKRLSERMEFFDEGDGEKVSDNSLDIEDKIISSLDLRETKIILDGLDDTDKKIVILRCVENLSWREVAEKLSSSEASVRKRFERARKRIIIAKGEKYGG